MHFSNDAGTSPEQTILMAPNTLSQSTVHLKTDDKSWLLASANDRYVGVI